jgi:hypothetical protein
MSNELSLPQGFGAVSSVFGGNKAANDELGAGVASSYGIIGIKGKVWSTRFGGKDTALMREDGDGPRGSIEVVVIKAAAAISKIYYKGGYTDGSNAAPDCWSANGITPDASVQNKCNKTCVDCPMNAWGSRVSEAGKPGKACADSRRIAVTPIADIDNETFGGPMLLRVPAASLKELKAYGDLLSSYQVPYYAAATRISFDPKEAYPKFVFTAMRPLTDAEAKKIMALRDDKRVTTVLNEALDIRGAAPAPEQEEVPASPFENAAPVTSAVTATVNDGKAAEAAAAKKTAKQKKAAEAARLAALAAEEDDEEDEVEEEAPATTASAAPVSFDDLLNDII